MASIFNFLYDQNTWINYSIAYASDVSDIIFSGPLQHMNLNKLITSNYLLTTTSLIQVDLQGLPIRLTRIN